MSIDSDIQFELDEEKLCSNCHQYFSPSDDYDTENDENFCRKCNENEFPLYPDMADEGKQQIESLIEKFKKKLKSVADDVISDLYCDTAFYIESDAQTNFKQRLMDGLCDYGNSNRYPYDFKKIREKIFKEYKEQIIADLNKDLLEENAELKEENKKLEDRLYERNRY